MSELMFELAEDRPLQQWQKWANLARLEAIRADKAEQECDTLLAALKSAPMPRIDGVCDNYELCDCWDCAYYTWFDLQRQEAIVEGE